MSLDYLSERGPAIGTMLEYSLPSIFGFNGPVDGYFDMGHSHDGNDDLGAGRAIFRHRRGSVVLLATIATI